MPDRRIIAIAVTPKAYDEILKLKGKSTWTNFTLMAVVKLVGGNPILEGEIAALPKKAEPKPKVEKPKAEKPTAEKPTKKATKKVTSVTEAKEMAQRLAPVKEPEVVEVPDEQEPTEAEVKAIEEGLPNETES